MSSQMRMENLPPACPKMSRPGDGENAWGEAFSGHTDRPLCGGNCLNQGCGLPVKLTCIALTAIERLTLKVMGGQSNSVPKTVSLMRATV